MKCHSSPRRAFSRSCGIALCCALGLSTYGALAMPSVAASDAVSFSPVIQALTMAAGALQATTTSSGGSTGTTGTPVQVAQIPLNIPPPIPPDIVLMLDDSGSMNANFMPDWNYLKNNSQYQAVIDASNNGVYYNPGVTYLPPPHADGTTYTSQTNMSAVPVDGFGVMTTQTVNLFTYAGEWECGDASNCGNGASTANNKLRFNTSVASTTVATYGATAASATDCQAVYDSTPYAFGGITFNNGVTTTDSGSCRFQYYLANYYFQYSTGPATGPYTVYYVAPASQGCGSQPNCVLDSAVGNGTNGAPAPGTNGAPAGGVTVGQNIANWFAYYHTRLLMAKSGLMTVFSSLNPGFRVGFGSINGRNAALINTFPDPYAFSTSTKSSNYLSGVAPFGNPTDTTGQRVNFWNWIASESANSTTPLRQALDAVGKYYSDTTSASKAWDWMSSDPSYSTRGSAGNIACRQTYVILTTDGFWNGNYSSAATADASNTAGPTFTPPSSQNPPYTGYTPVDPFQGGAPADGSPSLADVAMYYWDHDLQTGLDDEVLPNGKVDPAYWQHMVTFTLGLGFAPKYSDQTTPIPMDQVFAWAQGGAPVANWPGWPTPSAASNGSINNIADLAHAGVNGHGGFFSATDPQSFVSGLAAMLGGIGDRIGSGASLGANSTKLATGTFVYQAQYFAGSWRGDLLAIGLDPASGNPDCSSVTCWQAATVLNGMATVSGTVRTYPSRIIMTYNPQGTTYGTQFVPLKNDTNGLPALASNQLAKFGSNAAEVVNYLRGDNTNEKSNGGSFRNRTTPLGDIVDSAPVYAGAPDVTEFNGESFPGLAYVQDSSGQSYSPFYRFASGYTDSSGTLHPGASKRQGMIYVAANDGMLHAFKASDGTEVFAYLPGALLVNDTDPVTGLSEPLANLANPAYGSAAMPHQDYNDGQLTMADAYVQLSQTGDTSPQWHTILIGTTGRGPARSVYAIDVTDPANIKPLWERYAGDSSGLDSNSGYIGQMTGQPVIAQTSSGIWSVLIGNGYNSPKGVAALLQFNLATGKLDVHTTSSATSNGLAPVYTWISNSSSGVTDLAYAGDLNGNVWQFNLATTTCTGSGTNQTCAVSATPNSSGKSIFVAKDGSGNLQPITSSVVVAQNPTDSSLWLFFGSGKYLAQSDISNTSVQTWYGLIVTPGSNNAAPTNLTGRSVLAQRSIIYEDTGLNGGYPARAVTPLPSTPDICGASSSKGGSGSCKPGWYMDLVSPVNDADGVTPPPSTLAQGERMAVPNQLQGGLLVGTTIIPRPANQTFDPCEPAGAGWIMAIDPFTGTNPSENFFDRNKDGTVGAGDGISFAGKTFATAGIRLSSLPNAPIFIGGHAIISLANGTLLNVPTGSGSGTYQRVSWRELVNP